MIIHIGISFSFKKLKNFFFNIKNISIKFFFDTLEFPEKLEMISYII